MFTIDGIQWDLPCDIARTAEIRASDISGLMLDRSYFNDVLGTYMQYDVKIVVPFGYEQSYNSLYEILTTPVDGHAFVLPYDGGVLNITARVETVKDLYTKAPNGETHWRGIAFSAIANHPSKKMELDEVITLGPAPLPEESTVNVGSAYIYTQNGWAELPNADDTYY